MWPGMPKQRPLKKRGGDVIRARGDRTNNSVGDDCVNVVRGSPLSACVLRWTGKPTYDASVVSAAGKMSTCREEGLIYPTTA